jgi:CO/xanthine dehydrogenase FAD-binding subunit
MIPDTYEYRKPQTLAEALTLREQGALCLAGGTDLVVQLRNEEKTPSLLIDLKAIPELQGVRPTEEGLFIGAATPIQDVIEHDAVRRYQALVEGGGILGCYEIRQRATIGGNICNASPSADTLPGLLVHGAQALIATHAGQRTMPLDDFLRAPGTVALTGEELLMGVVLPAVSPGVQSRFYRRSRVKGMDLASVNVAVLCDRDTSSVRIAIGAVWPTVRRAQVAEQILSSAPFSAELLREALDALECTLAPREGSLRATPQYKRSMVRSFIELGFTEMMGGEYV